MANFKRLFFAVILISISTDLLAEEKLRYSSRCPELSKKERIAHEKLPYYRVPARYPSRAVKDRIEGYVVFEFDISKKGKPINIAILESYPKKIFVKSATRAFRQYKYKKIKLNGEAIVSECHTMKVSFKLG